MRQTNVAGLRPGARALMVAFSLAGSPAWALGFGPAHGVPQLGRPFYTEIPLLSAQDLDLKCIEFLPATGEEIYFPLGLAATIEGPLAARRIVVRSRMTVREPLVVFQVRAGCDAPFQREYSLLTEAPTAPLSEMEPPAPAAPAAQSPVADQPPAAAGPPSRQGGSVTARTPNRAVAPKVAAQRPQRTLEIPEAQLSNAGRSVVAPADRLAVAGATSQYRMLSDAIVRLEQGQAQRERIQGELVGAISGAVVGIVEVREQLRNQQEELKQLRILLEREQRLRAEEARRKPDAYVVFAMILASGAVGAGLMLLHHMLGQRRREARVALPSLVDPAPAFDRTEPDLAEALSETPLVMPPARIVKAPTEETATSNPPNGDPVVADVPPAAPVKNPPEELQPKKRAGYTVGGAVFGSLDTTVDSAPVQPLAADIALPVEGSRRAAADPPAAPLVIDFDLGRLGKKPGDS